MLRLSDTVDRKFIDSIRVDHLEVETDSGWEPITHIHQTILYEKWQLTTESGLTLFCADDHIVFDEGMEEVFVKNLISDVSRIWTVNGLELVIDVVNMNILEHMFDLSLDSTNKRFYTAGILSHNSTILDAITYALFNKPFRKINKPQLVNTVNNGDCMTEIEFSLNNKKYKIVRGIKPSIFEIYENGKMIHQDAAIKDYQQYLEENILRMTYKAFCQIVVIGNATYQPFMKLNPVERRAIVENFLDIDVFTKMNGLLKSRIVETKEQINGTSYKVDLAKEKIRMAEKLLSSSEESIDAKINANNIGLDKKRILLAEWNQDMRTLSSDISTIIINDQIIQKTKAKIREVETLHTTISTKYKSLNKEVDFLNNNDSCPTCKQEIDEEFKSNNISDKTSKIAKYVEAMADLSEKISHYKNDLAGHMELVDEIDLINTKIRKLEVDIEYLTKDINRISEDNRKLIEEKQNNIKKNKEEYSSLVTEHLKLTDDRDTLLENQHQHSIAAILLKDDGIKTKIIKHYLPAMNKLINKYLHLMDFYVSYTLDENFSEVIKQANKESFSYASFSEGEKLRIDLAILFAWREIAKAKNSTNTNLLILDEIFDSSLDGAGVEDFIGILNTISENTNVFIISHRGDQVADKFQSTLKFAKLNGFSKLV